MAHFLPAGKLLVFFAKSAVKPISRRIVSFTKDRPAFVKSCVWMANKNHQMYLNISKWSGNRLPYAERLADKHKKMTDQEAVEFFTDMLGEMLIIGAGIGFIVWEYRRSKNHRKTSKENDVAHSQRLDELEETVIQLNHKIDLIVENTMKTVFDKQ